MSTTAARGIGSQLDAMRSIKDGWLDGEGLAPPGAGLDWLPRAFGRYLPEDAPLPYLYPTEMEAYKPNGLSAHTKSLWPWTLMPIAANGMRSTWKPMPSRNAR